MLVLLAGQALAAGGDGESQTPISCRYFYQLIPQQTSNAYSATFSLYVERTDEEAPPLHGGNIALSAPLGGGEISFIPEAGWLLTSYSGDKGDGTPATQVLEGNIRYISFHWLWDDSYGTTDPPSGSTGDSGSPNRQLLGTLEIPNGKLLPEDVELLPWTETELGAQLLAQWQADVNSGGDAEASLEILQRVFRMEDLQVPTQGYYQGQYAYDDGEGGKDIPVDLVAGWQKLRLGAYAPERPATLSFYRTDEDPAGVLVATASVSFGQGTGYFRSKIDFETLEYTTPDDPAETVSYTELPNGVYTVKLEKLSHVDAVLKGLTKSDEGLFPELMGVLLILPCGDVDHSGAVQQADRAKLTAQIRYGRAMQAEIFDLDGDGRVDQKDLSILIAPTNYSRKNIEHNYSGKSL